MYDLVFNYGMITIKLAIAIATAFVFLKIFNMNAQLKQMTPLDIVLNFLLGAILSNFILDRDISLTNFFFVVLIFGILLYAVNWFSFRTDMGRRIFIGSPKIIIQDGKFNLELMRRLKLNVRDMAAVMRRQKIRSLKDIEMAQIETNGDLTIVKKGSPDYSVILIDNGVIDAVALQKINKDEKWLRRRLKAMGINDPEEIFIAQWYDNRIQIIKKD